MTIAMRNFGLTWTDASGIPCVSAVAYDEASAGRRKKELEGAGATGIEIVPVKPGHLPAPPA
ncbi:hypothetical protein [Streptomyces sp. AS58]|uniref:hypothetical protein n=1 Tax=Streptomyces sp. AS58 TaxID=1519489 RepID=UPI000AF82218|nr:hypothetical protein [Streptomyces sp. AS58]